MKCGRLSGGGACSVAIAKGQATPTTSNSNNGKGGDMKQPKEWTVGELNQFLSHLPDDTKIKLEDADTGWMISKFDIIYKNDDTVKELWFYPSDYSEMN